MEARPNRPRILPIDDTNEHDIRRPENAEEDEKDEADEADDANAT